MKERLRLSIIIVSYNAGKSIERCLKSLGNQSSRDELEIIVVDSSSDHTDDLVEQTFPEVILKRSRQRIFPGEARNTGITLAKGEIIAFLDADCVAATNWAHEILEAHRGVPAIGGSIANGNPESRVGWAAYFCEFSQWMPGTPPGWMADIPTANMSYKRDLFDKFGCFLEGTYCSDTDFHWRLFRQGVHLRFNPSMAVSHINIACLTGFLKHEFFHGRSFAGVRVRGQEFSGKKRWLMVLLAPLVPARIFSKVLIRNIRNRVYLRQFIRSLPLLALGIVCWSLGEIVGYVETGIAPGILPWGKSVTSQKSA